MKRNEKCYCMNYISFFHPPNNPSTFLYDSRSPMSKRLPGRGQACTFVCCDSHDAKLPGASNPQPWLSACLISGKSDLLQELSFNWFAHSWWNASLNCFRLIPRCRRTCKTMNSGTGSTWVCIVIGRSKSDLDHFSSHIIDDFKGIRWNSPRTGCFSKLA